MPTQKPLTSIQKILLSCLVLFLIIWIVGMITRAAYSTSLEAIQTCTGTGCITMGQQRLGLLKYSPIIYDIGLLGIGSVMVLGAFSRIIKLDAVKHQRMLLVMPGTFLLLSVGILGGSIAMFNSYKKHAEQTFSCPINSSECNTNNQSSAWVNQWPSAWHLGITATAVSAVYMLGGIYLSRKIQTATTHETSR